MAELKKVSRKMHYQTFLVSCWQEHDEVTDKASLRFRVEFPKSGEHYLVASLKDVIAVIEIKIHKTLKRN